MKFFWIKSIKKHFINYKKKRKEMNWDEWLADKDRKWNQWYDMKHEKNRFQKKTTFFEQRINDIKVQSKILKQKMIEDVNFSTEQKLEDLATNLTENQLLIIRSIKQEDRSLKKTLHKLKVKNSDYQMLCEKYEQKIIQIRDDKLKQFFEKYKLKKQNNIILTKKWFANNGLSFLNKSVGKLDGQRHLNAVKTSLYQLMPFILLASLFVLINSVILSTDAGGLLSLFNIDEHAKEIIGKVKNVGGIINNASMGILGAMLSLAIGYNLGRFYKRDGFVCALIAFSVFIELTPLFTYNEGSYINFNDLGTGSMFLAIFGSLLSIELYRFLENQKRLKIHMPASVPPAVAKSFDVLIPLFITIIVFGLFAWLLVTFAHRNLNDLITLAIQKPLSIAIESIGGVVAIRFISDFLWIIGIHGSNIMAPITTPIFTQHIAENQELIAQGLSPKWIVVQPFFDSYGLLGGGSCALLLLIAVFLLSKRRDQLAILPLAIIPNIFNITEPTMFGIPIVLNPIYMLPAVFIPMLNSIIAYYATQFGFVNTMYVLTPWTTPPILLPFLASGGNWHHIVLALILSILGVTIYAPFVLISNVQAKVGGAEMVKRFQHRNVLGNQEMLVKYYFHELKKVKMKKTEQKETN